MRVSIGECFKIASSYPIVEMILVTGQWYADMDWIDSMTSGYTYLHLNVMNNQKTEIRASGGSHFTS